jgi:hypothetical protein
MLAPLFHNLNKGKYMLKTSWFTVVLAMQVLAVATQATAQTILDFGSAGAYVAVSGSTTGLNPYNGHLQAFYNVNSAGGGTSPLFYSANGVNATTYSLTASQSLSISSQISVTSANNASFGIYIVNSSNPAQGYLALFNLNANNGPDELIRFSTNAVPYDSNNLANSGGAGTLTTVVSGIDFASNNSWLDVGVTYVLGSGLSMTVNGVTGSISIPNGWSDVQIALRLFPAGYSNGNGGNADYMEMQNFNVSVIPEPSTCLLLILGIGTVSLLRWRTKIRS